MTKPLCPLCGSTSIAWVAGTTTKIKCHSCRRTSPIPKDEPLTGDGHANLTAVEAAAFLRRKVRGLQMLAAAGKVPGAFRCGRRWLFNRQSLAAWSQNQGAA